MTLTKTCAAIGAVAVILAATGCTAAEPDAPGSTESPTDNTNN